MRSGVSIKPQQNTSLAVDDKEMIADVEKGHTIETIAEFLCRTEQEVAARCAELGLSVRWKDKTRNN